MNASEILEEATLVIYYSFDISTIIDSDPNQNHVTGMNVSLTTGHINQGVLFNQSYSYFQINNLILLGNSNYSYSYSFWIYPFNNHSNVTFIQATSNNNWCLSILGFNSNSQLVVHSSNGSIQEIIGPKLLSSTWTHGALTYQSNATLTLYINGSNCTTTDPFIYVVSGEPVTLTIECPTDEFRVYSRQLTFDDIQKLANY
jgi:hypothetical protein